MKRKNSTPRPSEHPPVMEKNKYLGTTKASARMILVYVQKMYKIFRLLIEVPDYSCSFFPFFFSKNEEEAILPGRKQLKQVLE